MLGRGEDYLRTDKANLVIQAEAIDISVLQLYCYDQEGECYGQET